MTASSNSSASTTRMGSVPSGCLYPKEDAKRNAPHPGAAKLAMNNRKLQGAFRNRHNGIFYRVSKALAQLRSRIVIPPVLLSGRHRRQAAPDDLTAGTTLLVIAKPSAIWGVAICKDMGDLTREDRVPRPG